MQVKESHSIPAPRGAGFPGPAGVFSSHYGPAKHVLLERVLLLAVVLLLVTILCSPASAGREVKVALHELKPSLFTDDQGKPAGVFIDLIQHIAAQEGWNLVWVHGSFQENLNRLATGEIDLVAAITDTPEREKVYDFNREPAVATWTQVYALPGRPINTILDLDGKNVAVLRGDINAIISRDYVNRFNVNPRFIEMDTLDEVFAETEAGNADAAITSRVAGQEYAKKHGLSGTPVMYYPNSLGFAVPKDKNKDILEAIDRSLVKEKGDPTSFYSQTMQKWFGEKAGWVIPPYVLWGLITSTGLVILFVIMSLMLMREVRRKTAELSRQNRELQSEIASRVQAEGGLIRKNEELNAAYEELTATGEELQKQYNELGKSEQALILARKKLSLLNTLTFQDIQNSLFSLGAFFQLARDAGCTETAQAFLGRGGSILDSVGRSLDYAKKYQDLGINQPLWQNVNYVLINAISHLDYSHITRKVDLDDLEIFADPLLEDVFVTIMENVISHGAGADEVRIRYTESEDYLTILIEDNGPGIAATEKEAIFEWEYKRRGGSRLFLAREILSITGITIRENGEPGNGARFEIQVPKDGYRTGSSGDLNKA